MTSSLKAKCQAVRSGAVGVKPRSPRTSYEISSDLCFTQAYRVPAPEHPAHPLLCGSLGEGENNRDGFRAYVIRMALPLSLPLSFFLLGLGVAVLALACLLACLHCSLALSLSLSLALTVCLLYSALSTLYQPPCIRRTRQVQWEAMPQNRSGIDRSKSVCQPGIRSLCNAPVNRLTLSITHVNPEKWKVHSMRHAVKHVKTRVGSSLLFLQLACCWQQNATPCLAAKTSRVRTGLHCSANLYHC